MFKTELKFRRWVARSNELVRQIRDAAPKIEGEYGVKLEEGDAGVFNVSGKGADGTISISAGCIDVNLVLRAPASLFKKRIEKRINEIVDSI